MGISDRLEAWRAGLTPTNACLLLAGMLTLALPADAAIFGEVVTVSAVGEPLRAEIRSLGSSALPPSTCLRIAPRPDTSDGIAAVRDARVSIVGHGTAARIVVSTDAPVSEPLLSLTLENICDAKLRREYMLLLSPPRDLAALRPSPAPVTAPATHAAPSPRPAGAGTRSWITAPGESARTIAQALYPDDAGARRAFAEAVVQDNPPLFRNGTHAGSVLPTGTQLYVPAPARVAAAASRTTSAPRRPPAPVQTAGPVQTAPPVQTAASQRLAAATAPQARGPARSTTPPAAAPQEPTAGRLVLQPNADPAIDRVSAVASRTNATRAPLHPEEQMQIREELLVAAIDRTIDTQLELIERMRRLEEIQVALRGVIEASDLPLELASREPGAAVTSATADDAIPEREGAPTAATQQDWAWWALLLGVLGVGAGALTQRQRRNADDGPSDGTPRVLSASTAPTPTTGSAIDTAGDPTSHGRGAIHPVPPGGPAAETNWDSRSSAPELPSLTPAPLEEEIVEEHDSAVELAEIMMSFGRVQGAADTLAEFIRSNPKRAIAPWLKLMDVYRLADMRDEFDTLARQLNKTFNVQTVTWDNFEDSRKPTNSVEQMPHIIKLLVDTWGTRECQAYLETILRDNRDGTRQGFALGVIDEIVMLAGVLEDQLGRCQTDENHQEAVGLEADLLSHSARGDRSSPTASRAPAHPRADG